MRKFLPAAILGQVDHTAHAIDELFLGIIHLGITVVVIIFILLVYKDAIKLFTRPGTLGTGLGRIWAIARLSVYEAWAAKAWVVPIIWLVACTLIILLTRAFDNSMERVGLYLRVLLGGQEFLSLILLGVMACYSFPRERDRRTIITTASKPISRLELFLGKVAGFCTVALLLLGVMMVLTWGFMLVTNQVIKNSAQQELIKQQTEFKQLARDTPPSPALRRAAEEGELHAYDYITAPAGMQVCGGIDYKTDPPTLLMRGGSPQKVSYVLGLHTGKGLSRTDFSGVPAAPNKTPFFHFQFGYEDITTFKVVDPLKITVRAFLVNHPSIFEERTLTLVDYRGAPVTVANWAVETPYQFFWYEGADDPGPIALDISCNTAHRNLRIYAGSNADESNVFAVDLDPARVPGGTLAALGSPRIRGFEKGDAQQIAGPPASVFLLASDIQPVALGQLTEVATWRFHDIKTSDVPVDAEGNFALSLQLDQDRKDAGSKTEYDVRVYSPLDMKKPFMPPKLVLDEKRLTMLKVPATVLDSKGSDLVVDIRCLTPNHWIEASDNSVRIERTPSFFLLNLVKSELVIFCECALLILIGVTCSLRLGWPVAMLLAGVCYLLGTLQQFVYDMTQSRSYSLLSFAESNKVKESMPVAYGIGNALMNTSVNMLKFLVNALPDFTRFDSIKYIVDSRSMPWWDLLVMAGALGLYAIPFIAIGYLMIRKQELA